MHTPVLLNQAIESLQVKPGKKFIDATFGEGGHVKEIVRLGGEVLGIDWDQDQIQLHKAKNDLKHVRLINGNYADIETIARTEKFIPVDGVLFDLGLSMQQLSESGKGFSYRKLNDPLDMRIGAKNSESAAELLNSLNEQELYDIIARYSEDLDAGVIAKRIVEDRVHRKFFFVKDLVETVENAVKHCTARHQHDLVRTLTRVFQALRIVVNNEFENIKLGLTGALNIIKNDGVVAVITFHSLEDRIVKQYIRNHHLKLVKTVKGNRAFAFERSATLRVIKKNNENRT